MPKRSEDYMLKQRERFCKAAEACFRRNGVAGTSLADICAESRLSIGAFYKHFDGRDALIVAVVKSYFSWRRSLLRGRNWRELRERILQYREEMVQSPFWREILNLVDSNKQLSALRIAEAGPLLEEIAQQIATFTENEEIRPVFPPFETASLLSLIYEGSFMSIRTQGSLMLLTAELSRYMDHAVGAALEARLRKTGG